MGWFDYPHQKYISIVPDKSRHAIGIRFSLIEEELSSSGRAERKFAREAVFGMWVYLASKSKSGGELLKDFTPIQVVECINSGRISLDRLKRRPVEAETCRLAILHIAENPQEYGIPA